MKQRKYRRPERPRGLYLEYLNNLIATSYEMKPTQTSSIENISDAEDAFAFVRRMADDANKLSAILVQFERGHLMQYHGRFNGTGAEGKDSANYDPAIAGKCRTLAAGLHEFANLVKAYA
jgi:hypothetical protein